MKKTAIAICILFSVPILIAQNAAGTENKYVQFSAAVPDSAFAPGEHVTISFTLSPVDGVHVNGDPSPELTFAAKQPVTVKDTLEYATDTGTGHLDTNRPITCSVVVTPSAPKGTIVLRGTLSYFFCSDEKGWCNHFDQPVLLHIRIRP